MSISYWLDGPYTARLPLETNRTADAVVIGAGMTGVGIACFLRDRGLTSLVLERGIVAGGATGRNAGFLVSHLGEHYAQSVNIWGRDNAAAISRIHLENHRLLTEIVDRNGLDCGYARCGSLFVAADDVEEDVLIRSCSLLQEDGFACELLDAVTLNRTLHSRGFGGALFNPSDGRVDPVRLVRQMARLAETGGVVFCEHSPVHAINGAGNLWRVETEKGSVTSRFVFLASNAWTPSLLPSLPLQPVRGQCVALPHLPGPFAEISCYTNYGSEYWRGVDGCAIFGGRRDAGGSGESEYSEETSSAVQEALEGFYKSHFPELRNAVPSHRWAGIMSYTPDGMPLVGAAPGKEGIYIAAGYTGHGFGYAFCAAEWLVRLVLDGKDQIPPFCRIDREMRSLEIK